MVDPYPPSWRSFVELVQEGVNERLAQQLLHLAGAGDIEEAIAAEGLDGAPGGLPRFGLQAEDEVADVVLPAPAEGRALQIRHVSGTVGFAGHLAGPVAIPGQGPFGGDGVKGLAHAP